MCEMCGVYGRQGGGGGVGRPPRTERGMEMQMTFGAGLESLAQRTTTKKQEYDARKADTVWEKVERRRRCAPPPPRPEGAHCPHCSPAEMELWW